uniref:Hormone-sensitive lipase n=1 Tax=Amphiprion percula TaxID=161767 RepID=A0A3P8U169_AMPPE
MDYRGVFATLERVCEDNISVLCGPSDLPYGSTANRLLTCIRQIQEHGRALEPVVGCFTVRQRFYSLCPEARYVASNYNSAFFRAEHNAAEMEAYCSALCQLRALLHLAQRLINDNDFGQLYSLKDEDLSRRFVQEYSSMHKACFYGRCLGFQFSPALRPFLQTVVISMVSYGETFGKQQSGFGTAALSLLTSGKYVMDPELRGAEFERITQNLDLQFWKSFWNLTESGLLTGFSRMASSPVQVNLTLTLPPVTLRLPLAADPNLTITISPPIAHWGPGPVHMRLISWELREGQDSEELQAFYRSDPPPISVSSLPWVQKQPPSRWLLIHFHGGGFVAQTSRSHENYLRSWSKELNVPILSVDYSLSPEAPFPRALEECFYAYCWALNHCHLLGSTAERVCLAGDSAGGNLCITVSMKAISAGIRVPDGIMAAYPATLLTTDASPSRLLTSIDPLLPLGVLAKCLNAYAGAESGSVQPAVGGGGLSSLGRDTAMLLSDLTQGASSWIQSFLDPTRTSDQPQRRIGAGRTSAVASATNSKCHVDFPEGFEPLRSECLAFVRPTSCPIIRNPFVSPLLAPSNMLRGLPPVHIVASALDALLDDSVMFAKKLRDMNQPVSLTVMEDLPHGFLSLSQLAKETEVATEICVARIRAIFQQENPPCALQKPPKLDQSASPSG